MDFKQLLHEELSKAKPVFSNTFRDEIASKVKETRNKTKMSQVELAKKSKIPQYKISQIESGRANVTIDTLQALFNAMGFEIHIVEEKKR